MERPGPPDDGQRNCPKHAEFYSKNKFEKLVHLVGFIIRIQINVASRCHVHYLYYVSSKIQMLSRTRWWQGRKSCVLFAVRCQICLAAAMLSVQKSQAEPVVGVVLCLSSLLHNLPSLLLSSQNPTAQSKAANNIIATGQLNGWIKLAQDV